MENVAAKIQGIPCLIEVTDYSPTEAQTWDYPGCGAEWTYNVLDRKGYSAAWLERKMTREDDDNIHDLLNAAAKEEHDAMMQP